MHSLDEILLPNVERYILLLLATFGFKIWVHVKSRLYRYWLSWLRGGGGLHFE